MGEIVLRKVLWLYNSKYLPNETQVNIVTYCREPGKDHLNKLIKGKLSKNWIFFFLFRSVPVAYGSSQASGRIGAADGSLPHSHRNTGSEPHLQPTMQLVAMLDP